MFHKHNSLRHTFGMAAAQLRYGMLPYEYTRFKAHRPNFDYRKYAGIQRSYKLWDVNKSIKSVCDNKDEAYKFMRGLGLRTPHRVFHKDFLENNSQYIVSKPIDGYGGKGVIVHEPYKFDPTYNNENYVHELLCRPPGYIAYTFGVWAVPTIRLTTYNKRILYATLRVPLGDPHRDNYSIHDNAMGNINGAGQLTSFFKYDAVTQEDVALEVPNFAVPDWQLYKDVMWIARHETSEYILGWDIAITDEGPIFLEVNARPGFDIPQIAASRGLFEL